MTAILPSVMDQQLGPRLAGHFDFTLLFEQCVFAILPACITILAIPWYTTKFAERSWQVRPGLLLWAKMLSGSILCLMYSIGIAFWQRSEFSSKYSLSATIMSLAGSLCNMFIIYAAHVCYLHCSAFLSLYFTITMLCDIAVSRSLFLRGMGVLGSLHIVIVIAKFSLIIYEEIPKRNLFYSGHFRANANAETVSGFWNRSFFVWLNPTLVAGFRTNFKAGDLPELDPELSPPVLFAEFSEQWRRVDKKSRLALTKACLFTLIWRFLSSIIPRLCFIGFSLSRPFLMERILISVKRGPDSRSAISGLIGATVLVFGGIAISRGVYSRIDYQVQACLKGMLTLAIYDKMQKLKATDLEKASAFTLVSTDVPNIQLAASLLHQTWSALLELGFGIYALSTFVGSACFLIFVPVLISTVATYFNAKNMSKASTMWNEKIQLRVAATSKILDQLKNIKAMGLSRALSTYLQKKRKEEISSSMRDRFARVAMFGIQAFNDSMTPVLVFAGARFWTRRSTPMSAAEVFSTYALLVITSEPLNYLVDDVTFFGGIFSCMERVQRYLLLEEAEDTRIEIVLDQATATAEKADGTSPGVHAAVMRHVTVTSTASIKILENVTIQIPAGRFSMVHGPVGIGKSVFLRTLLGEIQPDSGSVAVASPKKFSYCGQTTWLRNMTIKSNIVGYSAFVEALYTEVIYCCALDRDIAELPDGDKTIVGTDGCNLSGGQKQRLGLARMLYMEASTVVMDDALSSLDPDTSLFIFHRLLGHDGFFRRRGSTVVMATNQVDLLKAADVVFEIHDDGHVTQKPGLQDPVSTPDTIERPAADEHKETAKKIDPTPGIYVQTLEENGQIQSESRRHGDFALYGYFLRSAGMTLVITWISLVALAASIAKMPPIFMQIWLNIDAKNDIYFAGFAIISFGGILSTCITAAQYFVYIIPKSSTELHSRLVHSTMGATISHISHTDTGSILNRFSQDISLVSRTLPIVFMQAVFIFFSALVDIGIISSGAKYASPIMLLIIVVLYGVQYFYLRTSRQLRLLELEMASPFFSHFKETSSGIEHIRVFSWEKQLIADFGTLVDRAIRPLYLLFSVQQWLQFVLDLTSCFAATILVTVSTTLPQSTSDTALGLALLNLVSFSSTASFLIQVWVIMETCLGGLARIKTFCEETPQEKDGAGVTEVKEDWPVNGKIEFKSVTAGYESADGSPIRALRDATITIEHGQKIGISGRTGSGKSSLFMALLHLIECSGGCIMVDGRDIRTVSRYTLRSRITTLTQDGVEVPGSLRLNLYPFDGPQPTDDLMVATLQRVGLWDYIVSNNSGNLDGPMSDSIFSKGQKQLFFLARAILHQKTHATNIVIMDEATSSMDYEVDRKMQSLLNEAFVGCTVVVIAHRHHAFKDANVVLRLDSGNVAERKDENLDQLGSGAASQEGAQA